MSLLLNALQALIPTLSLPNVLLVQMATPALFQAMLQSPVSHVRHLPYLECAKPVLLIMNALVLPNNLCPAWKATILNKVTASVSK